MIQRTMIYKLTFQEQYGEEANLFSFLSKRNIFNLFRKQNIKEIQICYSEK